MGSSTSSSGARFSSEGALSTCSTWSSSTSTTSSASETSFGVEGSSSRRIVPATSLSETAKSSSESSVSELSSSNSSRTPSSVSSSSSATSGIVIRSAAPGLTVSIGSALLSFSLVLSLARISWYCSSVMSTFFSMGAEISGKSSSE